jgi:PAS domain S-box-containing protein
MQTLYKRSSVLGCFALLLAILVGDAVITKRQLDIQVHSAQWLLHTRQVLLDLSEAESLIKDAETGQRGFLYTGDLKYLVPYNDAVSKVSSEIDAVAKLTADNPRQQYSIVSLRTQTDAKLSELAETVALYRAGKQDEARKLVLADTGLNTMNNIRAIVAQMKNEEAALEASRQADYQKSIRLTITCIYLTSILAAIGLILLAYYIIREIHLREEHATQLRTREELFRVTLTSIGDAVIATDKFGNATFLNPTAELLTGLKSSEAIGKNILDVFPIFNESTFAPVDNPVSRVIAHGLTVGLGNHTVLRRPDGSITPIDDSAAPIRDDSGNLIGVVLVFRDITNNRKTEDILRKTEKLSAAARLSATVAHEINNPLEAIVNLVYICKIHPGLPPPVSAQLTQVEQELERVAHITRQTLGFYRDNNAPEPIQMEGLIESVFALYSNKFKSKHITIERHFGKCPRIQGVEGELKQVISNLVSNAADAAPQNGTILVSLECIEEPGSTVVQMLIEDDGIGVAEEHYDRIFEPFFTTKQDVGTGLGLWVTREILERYNGIISVGPRKNGARGAAFSVMIPAIPDVAHQDSVNE